MFEKIVLSRFAFLINEFGFTFRTDSDRSVYFSKRNTFVVVYISVFDEISFRTGLIDQGFDKGFSIDFVIELTSPKEASRIATWFASSPEVIERAVSELADAFRTYGKRIYEGDESVFVELNVLATQYWKDQNISSIRSRAEEAFAAKNYREAIRQYQQLGDQARPLDVKRLEMSIKRLGPNE